MSIFSFGNATNFDLEVTDPNVIKATSLASIANKSESAEVSVPLIWDQDNDSYYEPTSDNFYRYVGSRTQINSNPSLYTSAPDLTPHSYIKVCNLLNDRSVKYYISLNMSTNGTWNTTNQYYVEPNFGQNPTGNNNLPNSTTGTIAGRWEKLDITTQVNSSLVNCSNCQVATSSSEDNLSVVSYSYTNNNNNPLEHDLITGSSIRVASPYGFLSNNMTYTTHSLSTITGFTPVNDGWIGGVLAPNGKIYCVPFSANYILVIDPVSNTTSTITGFTPNAGWYGGVLAPNGKIYCVPFLANYILVIDPVSNTTSTITGFTPVNAGWVGGVLAPNGKIYCVPYYANYILVIDPVSNTTSTITGFTTQNKGWQGGVLAPNGKIYCVPYYANYILVIDPVSNTTSTITGFTPVNQGWVGGVLASNGKIYCVPSSANYILVIDPVSNTTSTITGFTPVNDGWVGGVLAPNGKIYCVPRNANYILVIDLQAQGVVLKDNIYYVINKANSVTGQIELADSYENALGQTAIVFTSGGQVATFERQAGWIRVEEGARTLGNGGDPVTVVGGTGNSWVRSPYNGVTRIRSLLPSWSASGTYYKGDRVIHNNSVWECLSNQTSVNPITPAHGTVLADFSGAHGSTMMEYPEVYIRKDHFDGNKWNNIKGADVSRDYTIISGSASANVLNINALTIGRSRDLHFLWLIHKSQYNQLTDTEKAKYLKHPVYHEPSDPDSTRTFRMTDNEAGQVFPSGQIVSSASNSTISFPFNHGFSIGKAIYYKTKTPLVDYTGVFGLTSFTTYYVASVPSSSSITVSLTKGGTAVSGFSDGGKFKAGTFQVIPTKVLQTVTAVSTTLNTPAIFTTLSDHQLMVGQKVQLFFGGTISNFTSGNFYYVTNPNYTTNTLSLATTLTNAVASTSINITSTPSATNITIQPVVVEDINNPIYNATELVSTDTLVLDWIPGFSNHWLVTGDTVIYKGNLAGLTSGSYYFVIHVSATSIKLASSYLNALNNVPLTISGTIAGSSIQRAPFAEITYPGSVWPVQSVNNDSPFNRYEAVYRGIFIATVNPQRIPVTLAVNTGVFTANGHGLRNNIRVWLFFDFNGSITNLSSNAMYWVVNATSTTFSLSSTQGGSAITSASVNATNINVCTITPTSKKVGGSNPYSCGIWSVEGTSSTDYKIYRKSGGQFEQNRFGDVMYKYRTGDLVFYQHPNNPFTNYGTSHTVSSISNNFINLNLNPNYTANNQIIRFTSISTMIGVSINTDYYIINKQTDGTFQLSSSLGGTAISISGSGGVFHPKIVYDLQPGPYYVRVESDSGIRLYKSYSGAVNGTLSELVPISPQPQHGIRFPVFETNGNQGYTYNRDLYGLLLLPELDYNFSTLSPLGWHLGNWLLHIVMSNFMYTESRVFDASTTENLPFIYSNRQAIFNYFKAHAVPSYYLEIGLRRHIIPNSNYYITIEKNDFYYRRLTISQRGLWLSIGCDIVSIFYSHLSYVETASSTNAKTGFFMSGSTNKITSSFSTQISDHNVTGNLNISSGVVKPINIQATGLNLIQDARYVLTC